MAAIYGSRTVGVVLSGMLSAGVRGLRAVRACGGFAMAQVRGSSGCFDMPSAAIDFGKAEIVLPPERLALALTIIAEEWRSEIGLAVAERSASGDLKPPCFVTPACERVKKWFFGPAVIL
jgi:two-component system, chemotaxis family, protein-glutamate methylesterase/glutaminase